MLCTFIFFSYPGARSLFRCSVPFGWIGATHTLLKTLICALLSLRTVHFLIKTWSLSIAVRMSPEGTCGTFIVKLLSHVLTHEILPAGCSLSQMVRASLLRVTEYMSRFEANNNGLMKEGCTSEYNWSMVTTLWTDFVPSLLMALTTQVKREFLDSLHPSGLTFRRTGRLLYVWLQAKISLLILPFSILKIDWIRAILSLSLKHENWRVNVLFVKQNKIECFSQFLGTNHSQLPVHKRDILY